MKSLMLLWQTVAEELAMVCHTSTVRDVKTVADRVRSEGESFFTISLTNFGKDFEKSLDQGFVGSDQFAGFKRAGGLPAFLRGFLFQIFDAKGGGDLLSQPSVEAIFAVRQLTLMFGKIQRPCSPERVRKAIDGYVQIEDDLREIELLLFPRRPTVVGGASLATGPNFGSTSSRGDRLRRLFLLLFGDLFAKMEREIWTADVAGFLPRHGPGATQDRLVGNQKFNQSEWPTRLEAYFPAGEFIFPNWRYFPVQAGSREFPGTGLSNTRCALKFIEPGMERPVRVVLVPKTLKTPRVIAIEPTAMQYAQQAVLHRFLEGWRQDDNLSSFLGFDDQVPNQDLARQGSLTGSLATLDLSEASDRVSNQLVQFLLSRTPLVAGLYDATRSTRADVPDVGLIDLVKYASMGSALCFPTEAMVFLTIIFFGIEESLGHRLSRHDIQSFKGKVRVFGDDIIVPVDFVSSVIGNLEAFGFKVNRSKSFWTGKFRESCGKEFYDGHDVSIVRFRRDFPTSRRHADRVLSLVSFRNQLYNVGLWETCRRLDETITDLLGYFPIVDSTSSVIGRHSIPFSYESEKQCDLLHRPLVRGWVARPRIPSDVLDGVGALVKWFISGPKTDPDVLEDPVMDSRHLERAGRAQRLDMKLRWATPY